ncbi:hypothetical protein M1M27_gp07 [Cellulophaga phage Ingeline_1]|uniref:Uncharacterized protein n=1 Tax=Cellulophaga phage Ingeline_1 TaxID=2745674 RepID=A0A8E5EAJ2_9CAUD|nr:hypothetical protein M1M27_gp07 [Cellulophaga phage Ingeline_1]QQV90033.1 hypothetical protein Ingeline2_44 [Cellulophaga phage Ingeline_2]QQV90083.1 hypothetical protein Ingeline3_44 [Cellulophaga phage Ingeline_3]QQV90133.1 hypothetical protein Ingeline4_44 [Cellulophaga phage Ingeline_4]QQV90182.1 hypothetical protein Ingeline5_43 [Cellulophaga phage Ingeline_5]QQV90232.1 hypothetical protein Ingeline6_44 [Cellulophaga phage Ingeline_6]QQV90282.1 hypothetical protein Ingeline7_44 [Cellu
MKALSTSQTALNNNRINDRYINRVLNEEGSNLIKSQARIASKYNLKDTIPEISRRSFKVSSNNLEVRHALRQRFVDMRKGKGTKKLTAPIHNKIVYSHFNAIINKLAFGLTQDIRNQISNEYNIEI